MDTISALFLGLLGVSLAASLALLLGRAHYAVGSRKLLAGPTGLGWIFTLWVISTVFFGGYFSAIRIPGLFDITLDRLLFLLLLAVVGKKILRHELKLHSKDPLLDVLLVLFLLLCLISMSIHGFFPSKNVDAKPWFVFLGGYLLPFFAFFCVKYFLTERDYRLLLQGLFGMGVFIALIAIVEGLGLRQYVWPRYIADPTILLHLDRARGPFLNAAFNGTALCIGFVAGLALLPESRLSGRLLHLLLLALFIPAIYYTRTRAVYLQFLIILAAMILAMRTSFPKWKVYAAPLFLLGVLVVANMGRLSSADRMAGGLGEMQEVAIRFELANKSMDLITTHPFFGVGLAQFLSSETPYTLIQAQYQHNHLIGMAAELGIIGLVAYLAILWVIFRRLLRLLTYVPEGPFINANLVFLAGVALLCNLVSNSFAEPSLHIFAGVNFYLFAGMVDGLYTRYVPGQIRGMQPGTVA